MHPVHQQPGRFDCFDALPEGICILSENGLVVFWNRRLAAWTGVAPGQILGRDIRERFPAVAEPEVVAALDRAFDDGAEIELPRSFGQSLLPRPQAEAASEGAPADLRLRSRASRLDGLDVCRYALLLVQELAAPAPEPQPDPQPAAAWHQALEGQVLELTRQLEVERTEVERLAAELSKALETPRPTQPAASEPEQPTGELEILIRER